MYYGQFGIDQFLHETFFKDVRNGFFVECGAVDGELESTCLFFEASLGWTGINVEPVPSMFKLLEKNRPNCINLNYALSDKNNEATFTHAIHPDMGTRFGNGSLQHTEFHKQDLINQGCSFESFTVQCRKFFDIFDNKREIDLFILDVEGHEMSALKGIMELQKIHLPKVFCIEHSMVGLDNLKKTLDECYKLHSVQQHNAIFVKR